MAHDSERVTLRIEPHTELGLDLLPDVLRQLGAMVRLLTDFVNDPRYSKVEVVRIDKRSPLTAELRLINVTERKDKAKALRPIVRGNSAPIRELERTYKAAIGSTRIKVDPVALSALGDFARQLRSDVATIQTANETMVVSRSLIEQIETRLGPVTRSLGSVTGLLQGLNLHAVPWFFTVYSDVNPKKVRCTFDEDLFAEVRAGIGQMVTVTGLKEYVSSSPWPVRVKTQRIEIREPAPEGTWRQLANALAELWELAPVEDRELLLEDRTG